MGLPGVSIASREAYSANRGAPNTRESAPAGGNTKFVNEVRVADPFEQSRTKFGDLLVQLQSTGMMSATHSAVEAMLDVEGRELLRRMAQDQFRLRAVVEPKRLAVVGSEGTPPKEVVKNKVPPPGHHLRRGGSAAPCVPRAAQGGGQPDAARSRAQLAAEPVLVRPAAASQDRDRQVLVRKHRQEAIKDRTGVVIGKKQLEDMVSEMATDFDLFYAVRSKQAQAGLAAVFGSPSGIRSPEGLNRSKFLVITTDGKGVAVVDSFREETRKAAQKRREKHQKPNQTQKPGPKLYRRRTAQVCAVYTVAPFCRKPEDIIREIGRLQPVEQRPSRPKPEAKRVWASVEKDAEPDHRPGIRRGAVAQSEAGADLARRRRRSVGADAYHSAPRKTSRGKPHSDPRFHPRRGLRVESFLRIQRARLRGRPING